MKPPPDRPDMPYSADPDGSGRNKQRNEYRRNI